MKLLVTLYTRIHWLPNTVLEIWVRFAGKVLMGAIRTGSEVRWGIVSFSGQMSPPYE